jgi:hypothetical protein
MLKEVYPCTTDIAVHCVYFFTLFVCWEVQISFGDFLLNGFNFVHCLFSESLCSIIIHPNTMNEGFIQGHSNLLVNFTFHYRQGEDIGPVDILYSYLYSC